MIFQKGKPNLRLRDERLRHHWSQQELADMIGATLNTVSRWERGLTDCSPYFRNKLCELFGKDAKQLWLVPDLEKEDANPTLYDPVLPTAKKLVGRDELLRQLRWELCTLQEGSIFALVGMPGAGKSALAIALAHDAEIRERFYEGILWVDAGLQPNIVSILSRWGALLGVELGENSDLTARDGWLPSLRRAIGTRRMLIILDNIWRLEDAMLLLHVGGPYCTYLVTTRFINIALHTAGERMITVPELTEEDGLQLLERIAPAVVRAEPVRSRRLVRFVGGLPLALVLIGQYLRLEAHNRQPRRLHLAFEWLYNPEKRLQLELPLVALERSTVYSTLSLQAAIAFSDERVSQQAQEALRLLSVFPAKPNTFSEQAALAITGAPVEVFDQLSDAGLLESGGPDRYSLHRCIVDYAALHVDKQLAERRLAEYFVGFIETYQAFAQEQINLFAALLFVYKHRMHEEWEKIAAVFFKYKDSWILDDLVNDALKCISPCLRVAEDFAALASTLHRLGKKEWRECGACDYQTNDCEHTYVMLTNFASAR